MRMPRCLRDFEFGGTYHVISRGSNRSIIYRSDEDRSAFLHLAGEIMRRYELRWLAYCLMPNHYHALVETPDERLSDAMRDLNGGYSRRCSTMYGRDAHLFRNRFRAEHVVGLRHLVNVVCYIETNPVRARLCADPIEWDWSSHRAVVGLGPAPSVLDPGGFLRHLSDDVNVARKIYANYVRRAVEHRRV
jgi:REP-associated tyrosine transposase